jgi:hypothetical protein
MVWGRFRRQEVAMKSLNEIKVEDIDLAFQEATVEAAQATLARGLPVVGLDPHGNLVEVKQPIEVEASPSKVAANVRSHQHA